MNSLIRAKLRNVLKMGKTSFAAYCTPTGARTWNILRVNHVAVATKNLDNSVKLYRDILGVETSESISLPEHGITTVFVDFLNTKMELLLPLGYDSPIENFLEKNPTGGLHHISLEVDNIKNAVKDLEAKEVRLLRDERENGPHGKSVVFLYPKDCGGVLIALEQAQ